MLSGSVCRAGSSKSFQPHAYYNSPAHLAANSNKGVNPLWKLWKVWKLFYKARDH